MGMSDTDVRKFSLFLDHMIDTAFVVVGGKDKSDNLKEMYDHFTEVSCDEEKEVMQILGKIVYITKKGMDIELENRDEYKIVG